MSVRTEAARQRLYKHINFDLPDEVVKILNLALDRTGDDPSEMMQKALPGLFERKSGTGRFVTRRGRSDSSESVRNLRKKRPIFVRNGRSKLYR
jgi:hypothetical protein